MKASVTKTAGLKNLSKITLPTSSAVPSQTKKAMAAPVRRTYSSKGSK